MVFLIFSFMIYNTYEDLFLLLEKYWKKISIWLRIFLKSYHCQWVEDWCLRDSQEGKYFFVTGSFAGQTIGRAVRKLI